jgi:hypothetical protein
MQNLAHAATAEQFPLDQSEPSSTIDDWHRRTPTAMEVAARRRQPSFRRKEHQCSQKEQPTTTLAPGSVIRTRNRLWRRDGQPEHDVIVASTIEGGESQQVRLYVPFEDVQPGQPAPRPPMSSGVCNRLGPCGWALPS